MSAGSSDVVAPTEPDTSVYNAYIAGLTLRNVEVVRLYGERIGAGEPNEVKFDTALGFSGHGQEVNYRYDVTARLVDSAGNDVARVEVAAVLITASSSPSDEPTVARFAGTSGAMMAFPFLREAIATTAQRIGLPGVMMPIIRTTPATSGDDPNDGEE